MADLETQDPEPTSSLAPETLPRPSTRRKREVEEWALVLSAEGLAPRIRRHADGYHVEVAPEHEARAWASIESWRRERAERAQRTPPPPTPAATPLQMAAAYVLALLLLAFHLGLDQAGRREGLIDLGASRAVLVHMGEYWRLLTALTLHADLPHVVGNTLFGGFFLAALSARLGVGCSALAFVVTGALGNYANALYYGTGHSSIGASTGVFGLVGVLAGLAAWRRHLTAPPGRGAWVAFGAGLGVVAMLGSGGPRVDFSAHLFGLAAGGLSGLLLAAPIATKPRPRVPAQAFALALTALLIAGAWTLALHTQGPPPA